MYMKYISWCNIARLGTPHKHKGRPFRAAFVFVGLTWTT